jgi:hypothetical protein
MGQPEKAPGGRAAGHGVTGHRRRARVLALICRAALDMADEEGQDPLPGAGCRGAFADGRLVVKKASLAPGQTFWSCGMPPAVSSAAGTGAALVVRSCQTRT